jgi:hypothetical protein
MSCLYDISLILEDLKRHILKKKKGRLEEPIWSFPLLNEKKTLRLLCGYLVTDLLFFLIIIFYY